VAVLRQEGFVHLIDVEGKPVFNTEAGMKDSAGSRKQNKGVEMLRYFAVAATALCLAGCDYITAAVTPASDRINAAFPLPEELQTASARLLSSLETDKPAQQQTADQFDKLLKVRALTCTATAPVGRFDSPLKIRGKVTDTACFQQQDAVLTEWVGLRRLGLALREAPAYPLTPLPAKGLMPNFSEHVSQVTAAEQANVLVVQGQRFTALQLPGGKQISSFAVPDQRGGPVALSPNGRLLAVPLGKGLRILDVASGATLWNTDKYGQVIGWLPKLDLVVLSQVGTGAPHFLDTRRGTQETYPATENNLTWSLPVDGEKLLVGGASTVSLMRHSRDANGALDIAAVKQWTLPAYRNTSTTPHLMSQGKKLVYSKNNEVGWLNLETGEQGAWQVFSSSIYIAKVSDTAVLVDTNMPGTPPNTASRVLDVDKLTIATAKDLDARDGNLFSLAPRTGYLKKGGNAVIVGGSVESENPQDLERAISDAMLAQQLAKLKASDPCTQANVERTPERQAYMEALAKQVRAMNTQSAIRDGLPRDVIDAIRQGRGPNSISNPNSIDCGGGERAMPAVKPMLAGVPENAKLSVIGVYEAEGATPRPGGAGGNRSGSIRINLAPGSAPLILALSSYEPVTWVINANGRKIHTILVSGYYESTVVGQGNAQVLKIGSTHAYKMDSPEYLKLKQDIARYVSNPVQVFQGGYKGREFVVQ
jgi:hypothetical protein